jgi:hypothetical protein
MFFGRHELRGSWSRYVVCRSYEATKYNGRVLSGSEAVSAIAELLRDLTQQQVRALYAELTNSFDLTRVSNDEVRRWFSRELGDGAHGSRVTGLALVEVPMFGRLGHSGDPASAWGGAANEPERLVRAIEAARGKGDLVHAGDRFRLVVVSRAVQMPGRDGYEALGAPEAQGLLQAMAKDARLSESVRQLLEKAVDLIATAQNGQPGEQLVLIRRHRSSAPAAERAEPPMTPAQFARALKPKEPTHFVVVEVADKRVSL